MQDLVGLLLLITAANAPVWLSSKYLQARNPAVAVELGHSP
jgi:hypothetical protein